VSLKKRWHPDIDPKQFQDWVKAVHAVSVERYDATPEEMYQGSQGKLPQPIEDFYIDWYLDGMSRRRVPPNPVEALENLITDIEQTIETGTGLMDR